MKTPYEFDYDNYLSWTLFRLKSKLVLAEDGCLLWVGSKTKGGYGQIMVKLKGEKPKTMLCHRLLWELTHGVKLGRGGYLLNACENPACLNMKHWHVKKRL